MADLRVAIVGPLPPPAGGMANQTRQLMELLQNDGINATVIQVNPPYKPEWVGNIPIVRAFARLIPYLFNLWKVAGQASVFHIMANSGWSWHLFAAPAVWIAKLRGVRSVVNYRGGGAETFLQKSFFWIRPTLNATDLIVVPSGFLENIFANWKVPAKVIPNIINVSRFLPRSKQESNGVSTPHIVVTRNLEPIYDIPAAIEAFAIVQKSFPTAKLTIAGSGPLRTELEQLVKQKGIEPLVRFTGRLSSEEIAALYQTADVMLNSSQIDNMPNSVLEALASGVPVVSTDVGGVPFIVHHEVTALLVPAKDHLAMANAIKRILSDSALANTLISNGLISIQDYTWPVVREKWLSAYQARPFAA
jgi:glycosyltransferase involved in cell wall biosynthesis